MRCKPQWIEDVPSNTSTATTTLCNTTYGHVGHQSEEPADGFNDEYRLYRCCLQCWRWQWLSLLSPLWSYVQSVDKNGICCVSTRHFVWCLTYWASPILMGTLCVDSRRTLLPSVILRDDLVVVINWWELRCCFVWKCIMICNILPSVHLTFILVIVLVESAKMLEGRASNCCSTSLVIAGWFSFVQKK